MTLASDIQADYVFVDGIETVTHTALSGGVTAIARGNRSELSYREIMAGGPAGIQPTDVVWTIWATTVPAGPAQEETITDSAGSVWKILSVGAVCLGSVAIKYRCVCRKQV